VTTYTYDALGRQSDEGSNTSILYPDNNTTSTTYSGNTSTVKDPALFSRTFTYNGLDQLTLVSEAGIYTTGYTYDALNDLLTVTQGGQVRTFDYDSVGRMTSASNPESGLTSYSYPTTSGSTICTGDPNQPCTRTDARNFTTTYTYNDVLNRLTGKSYNDNPQTPPVSFSYDQTSVTLGTWSSGTLSNTKGRLTSAITTTSGTLQTGVAYSYDPMGRASGYYQCPPANCGTGNILPTTTNYGLAGDITSWTFGYTITNTISPALQITGITSTLSDSGHPATLAQNITYTPWGALSLLTDGCVGTGCTNVQETYDYNNRMQPVRLQLGTSGDTSGDYCMVYNYYQKFTNPSSCTSTPTQASTGNNGTVAGIWVQDNVNTSMSRTESYSYDPVNRLSAAAATGSATYNLAFIYTQDGSTGQYGNMTCTTNAQTQGLCPNYTFSATTNQVSGFTYDLAGNVLTDGSHSYSWDAEGRLATMDGGSTESITYNALGQRVNSSGGSTTYNPAGEETFSEGYYLIPWNGVNFAVDTSNTFFVHHNKLQSAIIATNQTGAVVQDLIFYPWGQNWLDGQGFQDNTFAAMFPLAQVSGADIFTTLNRDYDATNGRWLSPDPHNAGGDPSDPQSWNMYAYARNEPTTLNDPTGETFEVCETDSKGDTSNCTEISDEQFEQFEQENKDTLTFTGNGEILQNGTVIGTYNQTSVDLSARASSIIARVNANHPGAFVSAVAGAAVIAGTGVGAGLILAGSGTALTTVGTATTLRYGIAAAEALQYIGGLLALGKMDEATNYVIELSTTPEGRELVGQVNQMASDLLANVGSQMPQEGFNFVQQIQVLTSQFPH
jgi:RHS repeat-associated protein